MCCSPGSIYFEFMKGVPAGVAALVVGIGGLCGLIRSSQGVNLNENLDDVACYVVFFAGLFPAATTA